MKQRKTVFGVSYHFVKVKPNKATGYEKSGVGNAFKITGVEKTIVDCFDLPQYSGGYAGSTRSITYEWIAARWVKF